MSMQVIAPESETPVDLEAHIHDWAVYQGFSINEALKFLASRDSLKTGVELLGRNSTKEELASLAVYLEEHGYIAPPNWIQGVDHYLHPSRKSIKESRAHEKRLVSAKVDPEQVVQWYVRDGLPLTQICTIHNVGVKKARQILLSAGVEIRHGPGITGLLAKRKKNAEEEALKVGGKSVESVGRPVRELKHIGVRLTLTDVLVRESLRIVADEAEEKAVQEGWMLDLQEFDNVEEIADKIRYLLASGKARGMDVVDELVRSI